MQELIISSSSLDVNVPSAATGILFHANNIIDHRAAAGLVKT